MCRYCQTSKPYRLKYNPNNKGVKQTCSVCGKTGTPTFIPHSEIPSIEDSKKLVWEITNDLTVIESFKPSDFNKVTELHSKIAYHNLYVVILNHFFPEQTNVERQEKLELQ